MSSAPSSQPSSQPSSRPSSMPSDQPTVSPTKYFGGRYTVSSLGWEWYMEDFNWLYILSIVGFFVFLTFLILFTTAKKKITGYKAEKLRRGQLDRQKERLQEEAAPLPHASSMRDTFLRMHGDAEDRALNEMAQAQLKVQSTRDTLSRKFDIEKANQTSVPPKREIKPENFFEVIDRQLGEAQS